MKNNVMKTMVLSAMFLSVGIVLPLLTMQIKEIGDTLLPMHIPVMLCGLICGPQYGLMVGLILPFVRGLLFSMPPLYPNAVWMSLELATYGFTIGLMYWHSKKHTMAYTYFCLLTSMVSGRIVWGIAKWILLGLKGKPFTMQAFITGGFIDAIPGIILQLILIPAIMGAVNRIKQSKNDVRN